MSEQKSYLELLAKKLGYQLQWSFVSGGPPELRTTRLINGDVSHEFSSDALAIDFLEDHFWCHHPVSTIWDDGYARTCFVALLYQVKELLDNEMTESLKQDLQVSVNSIFSRSRQLKEKKDPTG